MVISPILLYWSLEWTTLTGGYLPRLKTANPKASPNSEVASFSHNTLQEHHARLVEKGLVLKEKTPVKGFAKLR